MAVKKEQSGAPLFDYNALLVETIDDISRRQGFESDALEDTPPMSTGLLMLDLLYGGGIRPAWYTHFGPEQSAKTTGALSIVASAIKQNVPLIALCDYEGSTRNSKPYVANILKTMGVDKSIGQVFGVQDPTTGKWTVPPTIRYRAETRGEAFFDWLSEVLRSLPDKKKVNGKWWLVFEDDKANKAKLGEYANRDMARKYGKGLWVEAQDDKLQALIIVDSYPAMNPTSNDEEDTDNSIALQARMFSKQLPRVKGRLAQKMVAVLGTNQLRANPMDRYHPEVEPGGQALKFNCFGEDTYLNTEYGLLTAKEYHLYDNHKKLGALPGLVKINGWKNAGYSETIKLETNAGYCIEGKPGHKVMFLGYHNRMAKPEVSWKTLKEISKYTLNCRHTFIDNYVAICLNDVEKPTEYKQINFTTYTCNASQSQLHETALNLICDENFAELLGWIISEGHVDHYVTICNTKAEHIERIEQLCSSLGFTTTKETKQIENRKAVYVTIKNSILSRYLDSIGLKVLSQHKHIPLIIRQSPASVQLACLRGLFMGDGSAGAKETHYFSTSNVLLDQVHAMLASFGIFSIKKPHKLSNRDTRCNTISELTKLPVKYLLDTNTPIISFFTGGDIAILSSDHEKLRQLINWKADSVAPVKINQSRYYALPELFSNGMRVTKPKVYAWFSTHIQKGAKYWRTCQFYDGWYEDFVKYANGLRGSHQTKAAIDYANIIKNIVDFTKKHNIVWQPISNVSNGRTQFCFDANVPDTHTIITNSIVSHNSDCRCKFTPRASGMPLWPSFNTENKYEEEESVEGQGTDKYRYIQLHTKKNKLWTPNRKAWLRIWAEDYKAEGRGFDPVFDTACFLLYTGQLVGRGRKSMKLTYKDKTVAIKWQQLKKWVLGNREDMKAICAELGFEKPFSIRRECFKQIESGIAEAKYSDYMQGTLNNDDEDTSEE